MTAVTAVIPAAGRGSRLGYHGPKALTPLCGRPLVDFVLDALLPHVGEVVIVVSPDHRAALERHVYRRCRDRRVVIAVQAEPNGSAEAVRIGLQAASTALCVVAWCDQVGLSASTVAAVVQRLRDSPERAVLPVAEVDEPYVWIEYLPDGRIGRVGRARDGDARPARGMSDLGLFGMPATIQFRPPIADALREQDFVYELKGLSGDGLLDSFTVPAGHQTLAVNTQCDLRGAAAMLGVVAA